MKPIAIALAIALLGSAPTLGAPGGAGHSHSHSHKGPNGGMVADVPGGHAELVETASELAVYLTDEDSRSMSSDKASAKATVLAGGKTETLELAPVSPNKLAVALPNPLPAGARVVIAVKTGAGKSFQLRHQKK
jgi:hypothetical protein